MQDKWHEFFVFQIFIVMGWYIQVADILDVNKYRDAVLSLWSGSLSGNGEYWSDTTGGRTDRRTHTWKSYISSLFRRHENKDGNVFYSKSNAREQPIYLF